MHRVDPREILVRHQRDGAALLVDPRDEELQQAAVLELGGYRVEELADPPDQHLGRHVQVGHGAWIIVAGLHLLRPRDLHGG